MVEVARAISDLEAVAGDAARALKVISTTSADATKLSTSALIGSIGFIAGAGGMFGAVTAFSLAYGLFLVPLAGLGGLLLGVAAGRDRLDRANARAADVVERAWALRDREVEALKTQIADARREASPGAKLLEQKLTFLQLAQPQRLVDYYGLTIGRPNDERGDPRLAPPEGEISSAWQQPPLAIPTGVTPE